MNNTKELAEAGLPGGQTKQVGQFE
jgi:hypothetical protein